MDDKDIVETMRSIINGRIRVDGEHSSARGSNDDVDVALPLVEESTFRQHLLAIRHGVPGLDKDAVLAAVAAADAAGVTIEDAERVEIGQWLASSQPVAATSKSTRKDNGQQLRGIF